MSLTHDGRIAKNILSDVCLAAGVVLDEKAECRYQAGVPKAAQFSRGCGDWLASFPIDIGDAVSQTELIGAEMLWSHLAGEAALLSSRIAGWLRLGGADLTEADEVITEALERYVYATLAAEITRPRLRAA